MHRLSARISAIFLACSALLLASSVVTPVSAQRTVRDQCRYASQDCVAPLVCVGGGVSPMLLCQIECHGDRDCTMGGVCQKQVWSTSGGRVFLGLAVDGAGGGRADAEVFGVCRPAGSRGGDVVAVASSIEAVPATVGSSPATPSAAAGGYAPAPLPGPLPEYQQADMARYGTNIGGGIDLGGAGPEACALACSKQNGCRSWTYVNPGVQAKGAMCWLKSDAPAPVPDKCCVTGVR